MKIRVATVADASSVWAVHVSSIRELCAKEYTLEQIDAWAGPRIPNDYLGPISEQRLFVAEIDGQVVGFSEFEGDEINAVYVAPAFARNGVGAALLRGLVDEFRARGISRVTLAASLTSVPFYLAMGCMRGMPGTHRLSSGMEIPCVRMTLPVQEDAS